MKTRKNYFVIVIALLSLIALTGSAQALPDLTVTHAYLNPGDDDANVTVRAYINQSNDITAVVENTAAYDGGANDAGAFDVCFAVRNSTTTYKIGCANVAGLAGNNDTTVSIIWTPTCANFSAVLSEFPYTSEAFWINVTADCNCTDCPDCPDDGSNGKIAESDETDNKLETHVDARQWYGPFERIGGVVNNGYKAKHCDCNTTNKPLEQFEYYSEVTGGGFTYNTSGRRPTLGSGDSSTRAHHIDIPGSATVKEARLYVYWWNNWGEHPARPATGWMADLSVNCTNISAGSWHNFTTPDASYHDAKGFGQWQNVKGTYAYDVTSLVTGSGDYDVVITNIDPNADIVTGANCTTLLGEMLFVVYENPNAHKKMQLWWLEGVDYIMAAEEKQGIGKYDFHVSPDEATSTVAFPGNIDTANVTSATLFSVVAQGMEDKLDMLFNGNVIKTDAWDTDTEVNPQTDAEFGSRVNIESVDVKSKLNAVGGNTMGFKDRGTTGSQPSTAFLIICSDTQNVSSCDDNGNVETSFLVGDNVSVMGSGLAAGNYTVYIQPNPVEIGEELNGTYPSDPSTTQEWINITEANVCFGPTKIWVNIPGPATFEEWDIILDKHADGVDTGNYSANDGIASACTVEFVAPIPELATIALFGAGLLTLTGYLYLGKRRKGRSKK